MTVERVSVQENGTKTWKKRTGMPSAYMSVERHGTRAQYLRDVKIVSIEGS